MPERTSGVCVSVMGGAYAQARALCLQDAAAASRAGASALLQPRLAPPPAGRDGRSCGRSRRAHRRRPPPARHRSRPWRMEIDRPGLEDRLGDVIEQAGPVQAFHLDHAWRCATLHCRNAPCGVMREGAGARLRAAAGRARGAARFRRAGSSRWSGAAARAARRRRRPRPPRPAPRTRPARNRREVVKALASTMEPPDMAMAPASCENRPAWSGV